MLKVKKITTMIVDVANLVLLHALSHIFARSCLLSENLRAQLNGQSKRLAREIHVPILTNPCNNLEKSRYHFFSNLLSAV